MAIKRCLWFVLLTAASGFAQSYKTCDVTMWANETYSQASDMTRDKIFYFVRVGRMNYQIALPGPDVGMNSGQQILCRVDKGYMFIRERNGQVSKAQIVEAGQPLRTY
ncbi:MAG: hypothetical protein ABSE85_08125 [Candidatus Korobacteraceae bacterium]